MLSQRYRLPSFDIPRILKHGTRVAGNGIICIYDSRNLGKYTVDDSGNLPVNNEKDVSRFTFIVSTKIDKRATVRNRVRRLMSESIRLLLPVMTKHIDCIMIARRELVGLSQKEVGKKVTEVLKGAI